MTHSDYNKPANPAVFILLSVLLQYLSLYNEYCHAQKPSEDRLILLFAGDIMGHEDQIWSAEDRVSHTFNYDTVFSFIRPEIQEVDFAIANLEVTLGRAPYYGYPSFRSPAALASACKNAGFDCLVTANNHAADRRGKGIISTINILDSLNIQHTGTFRNKEEKEDKYPLILRKNNISVALLNYTYATNGNVTNESVIVNIIDKSLIERDITRAKLMNADCIVIFLHWGDEYKTLPSKSQLELEEFIFEKGGDIIIGSHPHVLQKMVLMKNNGVNRDRLTAYSLGNLVSDQRKKMTDGGAIVRIELTKKENMTRVTDAGYYLTWVYIPLEKFRKRYYIIPCSEFENKQGFFADTAAYRKMKKFITSSRSLLYNQNTNFWEIIYNGSSWLLNTRE